MSTRPKEADVQRHQTPPRTFQEPYYEDRSPQQGKGPSSPSVSQSSATSKATNRAPYRDQFVIGNKKLVSIFANASVDIVEEPIYEGTRTINIGATISLSIYISAFIRDIRIGKEVVINVDVLSSKFVLPNGHTLRLDGEALYEPPLGRHTLTVPEMIIRQARQVVKDYIEDSSSYQALKKGRKENKYAKVMYNMSTRGVVTFGQGVSKVVVSSPMVTTPYLSLMTRIAPVFRGVMNKRMTKYKEESKNYVFKSVAFRKMYMYQQAYGSKERTLFVTDKFVAIGDRFHRNCVYGALSICRWWKKKPDILMTKRKLNHVTQSFKAKFVIYMKRNLVSDMIIETACTEEYWMWLSKYIKAKIVVYNNALVPKTYDAKVRRQHHPAEAYHIWILEFHAYAFIERGELLMQIRSTTDENVKKVLTNIYKGQQVNVSDTKYTRTGAPKRIKSIVPRLCRTHRPTRSYMQEPLRFRTGCAFNKCGTIKYFTYDIETYLDDKNMHRAYAIAISTPMDLDISIVQGVEKKIYDQGKGTLGTLYTYMFYGPNCVHYFFLFLKCMIPFFKGSYGFAHNGGGFDIWVLLKYILTSRLLTVDEPRVILSNNSFINFPIYFNGNKKSSIVFRDSFKLFSSSLQALTNEVCTLYKKKSGMVDHNAINASNYNDPALKSDIKVYLEYDVLSLYELLHRYRIKGYDVFNRVLRNEKETKTEYFDILTSLTAASLSRKVFFLFHYKPYMYPIFVLKDSIDENVRHSYMGGRVECFKLGKIESAKYNGIYYFDFTSFYPWAGTKRLPYGNYIECEHMRHHVFNGVLTNLFYGFIEVDVVTDMNLVKDTMVPSIGYRHEGRLIFPWFKVKKRLWLFSGEIQYAQSIGYPYKFTFIRGYQVRCYPILKRFFLKYFALKNEAKKNKEPAKCRWAKLLINSLYGSFGKRYRDREGVLFTRNDMHTLCHMMNAERVKDLTNVGQYIVSRVVTDLTCNFVSVGIASAMTAYCRIELHRLIRDIKTRGYEIFYCDTDSIMTNCPITEIPEMKERWSKTLGKGLGELKNEAGTTDGKDNGFEALYLLAPKFYGLVENGKLTKMATKGLKKYINNKLFDQLTQSKLEEMITETNIMGNVQFRGDNATILQKQTQFKHGINNLFSGDIGVKNVRVDKVFGMCADKSSFIRNGAQSVYNAIPLQV